VRDIYVPPNCLEDAHHVLSAQDPEVSRLAERWPSRVWRAAMKVVSSQLNKKENLT